MSLAELRPAVGPDNIPTADELIIRARALAPRLRERAVKAERDRNIPQQSVDEYLASGLIHTLQPKRWGGYEHDHEVAFDIAIELGKSTCGSSAWCLNYLADHACILAHFPEEAQHDVWSRDTAACIATSAAPTGKVAVAPGGSARRPLVVVQRAAPFAMDHDWRARLSRGRRSSRHAAVRSAGGASEAGGYLVLCGIDRERLQHLGARQRLRSGASKRVVCNPARCPLAGIEAQHQPDLPHPVHRRAYLRVARASAWARAWRLCRLCAMDATAHGAHRCSRP